MFDPPQIVQTAAQLTAQIHLVVPRDQMQHVMGPGIAEVMAAVSAQGIDVTGPWFTHHRVVDEATFNFEICVPVAAPISPTGRVVAGTLPAAVTARTVYHGGYEGLGEAWVDFDRWIISQGHSPATDLWESYTTGPESSENPADWRTQLNRPLVAVGSTVAGDRYRKLANRFGALVASVPADRWESKSPCDSWTAADIVQHVVTTEADLLGRMPFAPEIADDVSDPVRAWPVVQGRIQAALDQPVLANHGYDGFFGPTTFVQTVDLFYSFDLVAHTWDLARATGLTEFETVDPSEIDKVTADLAPLGDNLRQPAILGPALDVNPEADQQTVFLALLGRRA